MDVRTTYDEPVRPQIIAHRGASAEAPEHTLAAYRAAVGAGADALECDVRLTADGHLVCVHDRRVNRTSDGRGLVSTLELARLEELDFGSWHPNGAGAAADGAVNPESADPKTADTEAADTESADGEEPDRDRNKVLTLRRLLELLEETPRRVELAVEVKHPTRYAGLVERRLVDLLGEFGLLHRRGGMSSPVRVMSFSARAIRRIHRLAPALDTVFLMEPLTYRLREGQLPRGVPIAGPSIDILRTRPDYVNRMHRSGQQVHVWTVDEPNDVQLCLKLGVDAIITNRPREVRALVDA
jgi:glycerophosphoryl diester phosphodiesterase